MGLSIQDSDWKVLRDLKPVLLERFCQQILDEIAGIHADTTQNFHQRYLAVFACVERRDKDIADMFNGFQRSTAKLKFWMMCARGLVRDDEWADLSEDMRPPSFS